MLGRSDQPHHVASTIPSTSPIAHPVRQCSVAETADRVSSRPAGAAWCTCVMTCNIPPRGIEPKPGGGPGPGYLDWPAVTTSTELRPDAPAQSGADRVPEKPALEGLEDKWIARWREEGTYAFVRPGSRAEVFSIDTPPPTVSGSLHVGHVFSYTHTDLVARYQRMTGKHVFYPIGWDDNGLPTERRVQNFYGVRCDPTVPYDEDFTPRPSRTRRARCGSAAATSWRCAMS